MTDTNSNIDEAEGFSVVRDPYDEGIQVDHAFDTISIPWAEIPEVIIKMVSTAIEAGMDVSKFDHLLDYLMDVVGGGDDE